VNPLVSVVIPVFNGERYLRDAVQSVLDQRYAPLEIIIVDDGSTDGTATVAQSLPEAVSYLHHTNQGPAAARNRGIEQARGGLIAFADADDLWPPAKLELQLPYLINEPAIEIAPLPRPCMPNAKSASASCRASVSRMRAKARTSKST